MTALLVVTLVASVFAQLVRDRTPWLGLLMYLPLWPLALLTVLRDALARGRALPVRWALLATGLATGAFSLSLLWTPALAPEGDATKSQVRVVQWNVQWGGRGPASLRAMVDVIAAQHADVFCLSEAPEDAQLREALGNDSARWHIASVQHAATSPYWYRLTVASRAPVVVVQEWTLSTGHAALFEVARQSGALRILMVDLRSDPLLPRSSTLVEAARIVDELSESGNPADLVLGDFNTPGRFLGFDALAAAGERYRRAAMTSGQWRGTWPGRMPLSLFDIDHIWVRRGLGVAAARLFQSARTDHRGQLAVLRAR